MPEAMEDILRGAAAMIEGNDGIRKRGMSLYGTGDLVSMIGALARTAGMSARSCLRWKIAGTGVARNATDCLHKSCPRGHAGSARHKKRVRTARCDEPLLGQNHVGITFAICARTKWCAWTVILVTCAMNAE